MKNFTKLLMAVVLLASYSCVQDTTEDLAPVISESGSGSGEAKTLQVSLPISARTELGEKSADGKYPVYWSEGDRLAVNGAPTTGIAIDADNKAVAVFEMPLSASIPYNIVYPYPGDEVAPSAESGRYPVRFMTNQKHVEEKETFAPGSAPMYAWSNGFTDVSMHHLSTVLRFSIKAKAGEDVKLRYVSVSTRDSEPIAGIFDVYCGSSDENDANVGSLEARNGASSTVFYNFTDNEFQLGETESVFYIAVPHGAYSGFEVDFVDVNGGVCVRTFDADGEFELKAGKVRSFPTIDFEVNSKMHLIGSETDMATFAQLVKDKRFDEGAEDKLDGALLVNDVVMTKDWTSVENFHSVFEGRDYTISGLTTPLFGSDVDAEISNVNVVADIEETANGKVGVIARSLAVGGKILNCSAKGSIKYDNTDITVNTEPDLINIGGVVGTVCGGSVIGSNSNVNIVVVNSAKSGETGAYKPCVGGVVGYVSALDDSALPVVVENSSNGSIAWQDQSKAENVVPFIGGVAGYVTAGSFDDNINYGALSIDTVMDDLDWGGVAGVSSVSIERCENKGTMTIDQMINTANIGGVLGKLETGSIKDCKNSGNLNFNKDFLIMSSCNIGGVVANTVLGTETISGCENLGAITYYGKCNYKNADERTDNAHIRIGGVVGLSYAKTISDCTNGLGSDISVLGELAGVYVFGSDKFSAVSGVVAAHYSTESDSIIKNCSNGGKIVLNFQYCGAAYISMSACIGILSSGNVENCDNLESGEVKISIKGSYDGGSTTATQFYISGLIGSVDKHATISDCDNRGAIVFDDTQIKTVNIGGILCYSSKKNATLNRCTNNGTISVGQNVVLSQELSLGGILPNAVNFNHVEMLGCVNSKRVEFNGNAKDLYLGGILGKTAEVNAEDLSNQNNKNTGSVVFGETAVAETLYMGGYCGLYNEAIHNVGFQNGEIGASQNRANASIACLGKITNSAYIGGFAGHASVATTYDEGTNMVDKNTFKVANYGYVYVSDNARVNQLYVSGCCGYVTNMYGDEETLGGVKYLKNYGTVEVAYPNTKDTAEYPEFVYMGGTVGYAVLGASKSKAEGTIADKSKVLLECDNEGTIIYNGIARDGAYIGGVVGKAYTAGVKDCHNTGKIVSAGNAGSLSAEEVQATENNDKRRKPQLHYHDLAIGGVVGETNRDIDNCTSNAKIYHEATINPLKVDIWGEGVSSRFDIGGVVGRVYIEDTDKSSFYINLLGLANGENGIVELDGDYPFCTRNTSSFGITSSKPQSHDINDEERTNIRLFYRLNMAGVVGRLHDHSNYDSHFYLKSCANNGNVRTTERAQALKILNIAGVAADLLGSHILFDDVTNYGAVTVNGVGVGTNVATTTRHGAYFVNMGGVAAECFDTRMFTTANKKNAVNEKVYARTVTFNDCVNEGEIFYNETAASMYPTAGGILAQAHHVGHFVSTPCFPSDLTLTFESCRNSGEIKYRASALALKVSDNNESWSYGGGIVGNVSCSQDENRDQRFAAIDLIVNNCTNTAPIQFERNSGNYSPNISYYTSMVGGIVGNYVGGIGNTSTTYHNNGTSLRQTIDNPYYYSAKIKNCTNTGRVHGFSGVMGGIIGMGQWFVEIDGCTNEGPVVIADGENPAYRNIYGDKKVMDAGGIAGILTEYHSTNAYMKTYAGSNEGWTAYPLGSQYARVVNCTNSGNVGGTDYVGGIVGQYRSLRAAGEEIANKSSIGCIENCTNTGKIYALDGMTVKVGTIVGSSRVFTLTDNTSYTDTDESKAVLEKAWHVGVRNCKVGGMVLRGANNKTEATEATDKNHGFAHIIYGETWSDENVSIFGDKPYDGCTFYPTSTGDNSGTEGEGEGVETTTVRR